MVRALKGIDVLLVVTRWFGGIMLGADRFKGTVLTDLPVGLLIYC